MQNLGGILAALAPLVSLFLLWRRWRSRRHRALRLPTKMEVLKDGRKPDYKIETAPIEPGKPR
jgi:hypothetical protein